MAKEFCDIATAAGFKPAQLALKWAADREYMGSVIIGATTMEQLKENIDAFDVVLTDECLKDVEKVHQRYRDPTTRPIE